MEKRCWKCGEELLTENWHYEYNEDGEEVPLCNDCILLDDGSDKEGAY